MTKPIYILVPYWMADFKPQYLPVARHTWRLLTPELVEGTPTERMGALCRALADEVANVRADGHIPVVVAGDCTASIGVLAGLQQDLTELTLVWYDAHGDFNTPETTPSNFIGGMPLAMLCGRGEQTIVTAAEARVQPEADVIITDARDLDPGEDRALAESDITHLPNVANLSAYALPEKALYVHFDVDVLHLSDLAAVSYPADGGPTLETVEAALSHLAATNRVAALSVSMWNPEMDKEGKAEQTVLDIIEHFVDQL